MTMTYTFDNLKDDVRKEAEALRIHATKEERERLDISDLRPVNPNHCIYGQMTGDCYCERACALIVSCTPVYVEKIFEVYDNGIDGIKNMGVNEEVESFKKNRTSWKGMSAHYSPIEAYILLPEAKNANVISYLRGETETLEL